MAERKKPLDQKKTSGQSSQKLPNKNIIRKIIIAAAIFVLLVGITGITIGLIYISDAPEINRAALETVQTSYLYDKNNREVAALHGAENRILVPLEGIPDHVQKAFIAIEDERFEKHFGWDIIGFIRAAVVNLRTRSFTQGASTITQQLVQNAFLTTEKTIKRKTQEIWLAIKFERQYSKEEILEMYLNRIYFGNGAYGVEAAAQMYFNKSVGELELHEAAYLAAIVRSPEYYNPFANEEAGIARTKLVLGNMKRLKFISEAEYEQALSAEFLYGEPPTFAYPHPYYVDYVVHHELVNILSELPEYGSREEAYKAIYTGGLKVYTTLDTDIQAHVETVLNNHDLYPRTLFINMDKLQEAINANNGRLPADYPDAYIDEEKGKPQPQSALVLTDPKTGAIWALGGGRNYAKNQNEDLRFLSKRQPGSAIKPVITYAPAIEEGLLGAGSALDDAPLIGPGGWFPENYDGNFRGMVTVRRALAYSYNLPAVRAYQALGLEKGAEYARKMGISTFEPSDALPSWTLGSREVTALDMAQAFSVFANNGIRVDLHAVQRIEDSNGQIIYEHKANPQQVLSPQTTFIINDILQDVVRYTTATGLQSPRPMAAKTGTTDDARDIYLCAYAPNIVASFWMGYDIN
ncbi:MAG TPA: PBP1A family penicillin-binding protein, partial [Bacillota bacterium]|nr:PBP1A family penicillin-binding protein [Bacillota bacterium]